jgi:hypothetical protein
MEQSGGEEYRLLLRMAEDNFVMELPGKLCQSAECPGSHLGTKHYGGKILDYS